MIVESALLFPGVYSADSGFALGEYYRTVTGRQLVRGMAENVMTIVRQVQPDYLNLGSEADTEAAISRHPFLRDPREFSRTIAALVEAARRAGYRNPVGAGVGTWQRDGRTAVEALLKAPIDYLDIHIYPVNDHFLDNAVTYADMAQAAGKRVAVSEAWLMKVGDNERAGMNAAVDPTAFSRDAYHFWAPLDQKFIAVVMKYARWKHLIYCSFFWTRYFWSYVPYAQGLQAKQIVANSIRTAGAAMAEQKTSTTGEFYRRAIAGK